MFNADCNVYIIQRVERRLGENVSGAGLLCVRDCSVQMYGETGVTAG